jgi:Ferritin-like
VAALEGFTVARGGGIDTREELIIALAIASELEHSLLVQYLYAAYSLKKWPHEGVAEVQLERIRRWERLVLQVAHDEMLHLATACKLSIAVGGAPHLNPPALPHQADKRFPFELKLQKFGLETLSRFIRFETPADQAVEEAGLGPDLPEYEYLGELYGQIGAAFTHLGQGAIVGDPALLGEQNWDLRRKIAPIRTAEEAVTAIELITEEGEGSTTGRADSHWDRFLRTRRELTIELETDPAFEPARAVVDNPTTQSPHGTLLPEGPVRELGELFNHVYTTVLMLIAQHYSPVDETPAQREAIAAAVRRTMSAIVRPLAEALTETPLDPADGARAGAPYETYAPVELGTNARARFAVLAERVTREAEECDRLAGALAKARLRFLAENLRLLGARLTEAAKGGAGPAHARV